MLKKGWPILGGCAAIGTALLVLATPHGVGLSADSTIYIDVARNLAAGRGVTWLSRGGEFLPMTVYPPLYPMILAGLAVLGVEPVEGARWLGEIMFAGTLILITLAVRRATGLWKPAAGVGMLAATGVPLLHVHSMAWSEPPCLFLGFLGLFLVATSLERRSRTLLLAGGMACGLASLIRYAGLSFAVAGGMAVAFFARPLRLPDLAAFTGVSVLPVFLWFWRNILVAHDVAHRRFQWHPPLIDQLKAGLSTMSLWLLPETVSSVARGLVLALVILLLAFGFLRSIASPRRPLDDASSGHTASLFSHLLCLFIPAYGGMLFVNLFWVSAYTPLDDRILSPLFVAALLLLGVLAPVSLRALPVRASRLAAAGLVLLGLVSAGRGAAWMVRTSRDGQGYASRVWHESALMAAVRELPDKRLYSNASDAVHLLTGRPTIMIPAKVFPDARADNPRYEKEMGEMVADLALGRAVLIYFRTVTWRHYLPDEAELRGRIPLRTVRETADGAIYAGGAAP